MSPIDHAKRHHFRNCVSSGSEWVDARPRGLAAVLHHGQALTFRVPEAGDIVLDRDTCPLPGAPGPGVLIWTAEPGSADADRLRLPASLLATGPASVVDLS
nr:hypothetical protein StreXyl84_76560 [Streptomyces sp. Xyl84]